MIALDNFILYNPYLIFLKESYYFIAVDQWKCKIADFGFARDIMANNMYERKTDGRLPIR